MATVGRNGVLYRETFIGTGKASVNEFEREPEQSKSAQDERANRVLAQP
jgi:hypothetical protein